MQKFWILLNDQLSELKANALKLTQLSMGEFDAEQVADIQSQQNTLVKHFQKSAEDSFGKNYALPDEMVEKIYQIQEENDRFIRNLTIRKSLIQSEMEDLNKASGTVKALRPRYGNGHYPLKSRVMCLG